MGKILSVRCTKGGIFKRSVDGYFVGSGSGFTCGFTCTVKLEYSRTIQVQVPGKLFGSRCEK